MNESINGIPKIPQIPKLTKFVISGLCGRGWLNMAPLHYEFAYSVSPNSDFINRGHKLWKFPITQVLGGGRVVGLAQNYSPW